jgi:hypothetical protein
MSDKEKRPADEPRAEPQEEATAAPEEGKRDVIGQIGGVYPASAARRPPPDAPARGMASFGQGERGAAGYEDHGESEVVWIPPEGWQTPEAESESSAEQSSES